MPTVNTPEGLADLITTTLPELDRLNFSQIAQPLQRYPIMRQWLRRDRIEMESDGLQIRRNLMQRTGDAAAFTGITDSDNVGIPTLMSYILVPWRHAQTAWAYHYQTDMLMNRGKSAIIKIIQPRRLGALLDMAKLLEAKVWTLLTADNDVDPFGVPYWIPYAAASGLGAFGGDAGTGLPAGHTSVGGLTDLTNFKPWCSTYASVSKTDLMPKMRHGHRQTGWYSPVPRDSQEKGTDGQSSSMCYYTNSQVISDLENLGEAQNENLGRDLAPYSAGTSGTGLKNDGESLTFRRHDICWVPQLDDLTVHPTSLATDPIYQIDHSVFKTHCLEGDYNRETGPKEVPDHHNQFRTFVESTINFVADSRRSLAVYSK